MNFKKKLFIVIIIIFIIIYYYKKREFIENDQINTEYKESINKISENKKEKIELKLNSENNDIEKGLKLFLYYSKNFFYFNKIQINNENKIVTFFDTSFKIDGTNVYSAKNAQLKIIKNLQNIWEFEFTENEIFNSIIIEKYSKIYLPTESGLIIRNSKIKIDDNLKKFSIFTKVNVQNIYYYFLRYDINYSNNVIPEFINNIHLAIDLNNMIEHLKNQVIDYYEIVVQSLNYSDEGDSKKIAKCIKNSKNTFLFKFSDSLTFSSYLDLLKSNESTPKPLNTNKFECIKSS